MSKNKSSEQLRYVKGTCELEDGVVSFEGSMRSVSNHQAWYYTIYAIKDKFPEIDYWIDPRMDECRGLTSSDNRLRREVESKFNCKFEAFPNGDIKPKTKLSELYKKNYKEQRANIDLDINVEWEDEKDKKIEIEDNEEVDGIPCGLSPYICVDGIRSSTVRNSLNLIERSLIFLSKKEDMLEELQNAVSKTEDLLGVDYNFKEDYMLRITTACEELIKTCNNILKEFGLNDVEKGMYYINIIMLCEDFLNRNNLKK